MKPIAVWPSDKPQKDENKIKKRLAKKCLGKEHYDLGWLDAVIKISAALGYTKPIFFEKKMKEKF